MLKFVKKTTKKKIILFIHGFTGGIDTWAAPGHDSFPDLLLKDPEISANYDIAYFEYFTKLSTLLNSACNFFDKLQMAVFKKSHKVLKSIIGINDIAELLRTEIRFNLKDYDEIIVVAHSMGGLIAKSSIVKDYESGITSKIGLFITLSTPHSGSALANYGQLISPNLQIRDLAPLGTAIAEINDPWLKMKQRPATKYLYGAHDAIVPKTSSVPVDKEEQDAISLNEDHNSICKPIGVESTTFVVVRDLILAHKSKKKFEYLTYQPLEDASQYDKELFVLKLIIADIKAPSIRNAKEVFLNAEYMRKQLSSDIDWQKVEILYEKVRKIYSDSYTNFIHGGILNSGQLLYEVHKRIMDEDSVFLACVASGVHAIHKQGMLHQLANDKNENIWWTEETGDEYLNEELKKR